MKKTSFERQELLQDVFAPDAATGAVSADDVLRIVARARESRRRRRQFSAAAALVLPAACVWAAALLSSQPSNVSPQELPSSAVALSKSPPQITPPEIERVDDEAMLDMIEDQPAALVRWPDGRQSLLLLVATPPK